MKREMNRLVVAKIRQRLQLLGLDQAMDVFPVENTFTRRPRFWRDSDGVALFKVHMWDLNDLTPDELSVEIDKRIAEARRYFHL